MHTANIHRPTPAARQPFLTFPLAPQRRETPPMPTHDFLMLSLCPDFTPQPAIAAAVSPRERALKLSA